MSTSRAVVVAVTGAAVVLAVALGAGPFAVHVATRIALFALAALGVNLLVGNAGMITLGHAAFLALGAYGHAMLYLRGVPAPLSIGAGVLIAGSVGLAAGRPAARLAGPYLAILTLGLQVLVDQTLARAGTYSGGRMGLAVPPLSIFAPLSDRAFFVLCAGITALAAVLIGKWSCSPWGRALTALRDRPAAAASMGIDPLRYRASTFAVSAAVTGLAGALMVHSSDILHPSQFGVMESLDLLVMVVVGGLASVWGSLLGAALVVSLEVALGPLSAWQPLIFGAVLLAFVLLAPRGLVAAAKARTGT